MLRTLNGRVARRATRNLLAGSTGPFPFVARAIDPKWTFGSTDQHSSGDLGGRFEDVARRDPDACKYRDKADHEVERNGLADQLCRE
jgi:hypothetical protein